MGTTEFENRIRISAVFYGRVQGVGFRYSAHYLAETLRLTGWVRNEYDGSVTVEIQGDRTSIDQWFSLISQRRFIEVERVEKQEIPLDDNERTFGVRY
ncbi:MAG: acylphosphatase [Lachnospiraceae bacterium]|nr:acylphosphatase [Lachnospiraceae bacterium]